MAGNILISFNQDGVMKVDYSGDRDSMFGLNDVDILRAAMAVEGMLVAQTGLSVEEIRELIDDERVDSKVHTESAVYDSEVAEVIEEEKIGQSRNHCN